MQNEKHRDLAFDLRETADGGLEIALMIYEEETEELKKIAEMFRYDLRDFCYILHERIKEEEEKAEKAKKANSRTGSVRRFRDDIEYVLHRIDGE